MDKILDNYFNLAILAQYYPSVLAGFWVTSVASEFEC